MLFWRVYTFPLEAASVTGYTFSVAAVKATGPFMFMAYILWTLGFPEMDKWRGTEIC